MPAAPGCTHTFIAKKAMPPNAAYWYRRAGRAVANGPLDDEWATIAAALLEKER